MNKKFKNILNTLKIASISLLSLYTVCVLTTATATTKESTTTISAPDKTEPQKKEEKIVHIYNWADYIDPEILKEFTKKTGIKVVYDVFDSNEVLETKLLAGASGYDVVVPSHNFLSRMIKAKIIAKLDKSKLPNIKYMDKNIMQRVSDFDPNNEYSINYMWGTAGLGVNLTKLKAIDPDVKLDSLDLIFNPTIASKFKKCGIYWLDASETMMPLGLSYLGLDPLSNNLNDFKKVSNMMKKARGTIQRFDSTEYISALANGDACIVVGYTGDIFQARDRAIEAKNNQDIEYIIPKEGTELAFDQFAILADAPHPNSAHIFLNYMMDPKVIAKATNYISYANGNAGASKYIDDEILNNKGIYPPENVMKKNYVPKPYNNKLQRGVNREWTKVITGQ